MKITDQKNGKLSESERLELARLGIKAGYTVRIGKEQVPGRKTVRYYVELTGDENSKEDT